VITITSKDWDRSNREDWDWSNLSLPRSQSSLVQPDHELSIFCATWTEPIRDRNPHHHYFNQFVGNLQHTSTYQQHLELPTLFSAHVPGGTRMFSIIIIFNLEC
jgi:hypothetical protein